MRILVFDPFHGAAGDMITGSLLDLGADKESVIKAMSSVVAPPGIDRVKRCGISAIGIQTNSGHSHRTLEEVLKIVEKADAPKDAIEMAKRVFKRLAAGEGEIHGENPHFHEVGADDAIADVLGACTAFCSLNIDATAVLPVATGRGYIKSAHGSYPNPAPATLAILKNGNIPVKITDDESELCTPTGAALLAEFRSKEIPDITGPVKAIGYGAGKRDPEDTPNVLRTFIVESEVLNHDVIEILETNVDDATGELISHVIQRLMEAGASDACAIPVIMKKGRPGYLMKVISKSHDTHRFIEILSEELGTLGIRHMQNIHRSILEREIVEVSFPYENSTYNIRVKVGYINGTPVTVKAEYEDLKKTAASCKLPLKTIARYAEDKALKEIE
ncbi:nickel pincer cofactor biosynthesis protein LarC [Methanolacinia paynteri]|uniref:nickel pincer cofactor biosynthesis protein LarC n=1 Tax=Methanolacinia paynteri TaxID=230356 RepID=UPI00064EFFF2|nr:nickel pincer cofactor biosynthesis protein LarC [Methanolacinia paynteri]